ncbi:uncharacterized protein EAE98_000980 [Botrytis deweyae]|uniref:Structure-specific endonuclease subunit SLX4 n=1 Tax=Botrytis deweyae TaxID=2478750 RepID=A0ABQ7J0F3_9HELO|nr:uncharacterized protein EAE98_000980 [Botrytis deweyae]KAF7938642.1 hypothetical protein EAE98_000980 [Botrytis deweyae]
MVQYGMDEALLSSPDPLADSLTYQAPPSTKRRKTPSSRLSLPLPASSPKKQIFELDVGNTLSPQKIRVTVEAEDSDSEDDHANLRPHNFSSPTPAPVPRRIERTTTTTVPLRGLSDSENDNSIRYEVTPKRPRGRPRKSNTPVQKQGTLNRVGKRGRKSVGGGVDNQSQDANDEEVSAGNSRSRSKSAKVIKKATPRKRKASSDLVPSSVVKRGRGRPRSRLREEIRLSDGSDVVEQAQTPNAEPKVVEADIHEGLMPEEIDLLATIDANSESPISQYPAYQSTSTFPSSEDAEEDVVIARFHPGEETPPTTGWSSVLETSQMPSSSNRAQEETSPLSESLRNGAPSLKSNGPIEDDDDNGDYGGDGFDDETDEDFDETREIGQFSDGKVDNATEDMQEEDFEDEMDDDMDHRPEFDTIMESEGFSLISLDSVPSLRKPLNGVLPDEGQNSAARPQNKNILSVQNTVQHNSFSSVAPEILEAATPGKKLKNPHIFRVQEARVDDSFSSIPPEILEAATPAPARKRGVEMSYPGSSAVVGENVAGYADSSLSDTRIKPPKTAGGLSEDSSSTKHAAPLDAATPRLMRKAPLRPSSTKKLVPDSKTNSKLSQDRAKSLHLATSPKPSKSSSPPTKESKQSTSIKNNGGKLTGSQDTENLAEESFINSQIHSSPPAIAPRRSTYTAHVQQQRQTNLKLTQTPAIVFSSPTLPPPIQPPRQPSERPESSNTNASSPAEKAGRILQDIVIPSSLPRSRSESLASPFKSPATGRRSSSSAYPDTNISRSVPAEQPQTSLPKLDHNGDLGSKHSRRRSWSRPVLDEDPFVGNGAAQRRPSMDKSQNVNLELPSSRRMSVSINAAVIPQHESSRTINSMNSQLEETGRNGAVEKPVPSSSSLEKKPVETKRTLSSLQEKWAAERAAISKQISTASADEVMVLSSDDDGDGDEDDDYDDNDLVADEEQESLPGKMRVNLEDDDNADNSVDNHVEEFEDDESFGLLLETLDASNQENQLHSDKSDHAERPKRSKIPSPWRTNSKRLVYSDELASLLPDHDAEAPMVEEPSPKSVSKQADVSKSSPKNPQPESDSTLDLSGWQIPQKQNFQPKIRSLGNTKPDISALLRSSPFGGLPTLSNRKGPSAEGRSSKELPSPRASHFDPPQDSLSGDTEEETRSFAPIPQKVGFQPRVRKNGDAPTAPISQSIRGIFGKFGSTRTNLPTPETSSSSLVGALTNTSPSRSNKLKVPAIQPDPAQSSSSELSVPNTSAPVKTTENRQLQNPKPKWTQHRLEAPIPPSPTKSILRSPLRSTAPPSQPSPSKNVVFASSSPQPSSPINPQLSPTHWTRDHWLLLDSILQTWKPENQNHDASDSEVNSTGSSNSKYGRRNSTRVISGLLGKIVNLKDKGVGIGEGGVRVYKNGNKEGKEIGNEKMRLEQWHLEAVDEFRGEVPGWDEAVVAKRVFALLIGEERRRKGVSS